MILAADVRGQGASKHSDSPHSLSGLEAHPQRAHACFQPSKHQVCITTSDSQLNFLPGICACMCWLAQTGFSGTHIDSADSVLHSGNAHSLEYAPAMNSLAENDSGLLSGMYATCVVVLCGDRISALTGMASGM